ncbi:energy-coupling factor transporter transmembrane protein EcfT [Geothermobacter ehrlichii]|uniref:Energy-coupling factor transporter transmembrane protein EcfT n=1 Tax=Geothermobacter ehrlichii TaxID=213224 RepID=A0A5D3WKK7_9BACT|nr:CbiQ family ECF transporter T component [Geothermobacter ehrlichii]TYO99547.1 energy-coupling factor transporter transmembrane protein EcfT [Geothermobacter ehrlichii]
MSETVYPLHCDERHAGPARGAPRFLHRLDPRAKLAVACLLIVLAFHENSAGGLLLLTGVLAFGALAAGGPRPADCLRWLRPLRWLLLSTVLLHLLFSPGHTLFGLPWLSRDGLLFGLWTCWQILLAFGFSSLLAATTESERLAQALGWFLAPLNRLGLASGSLRVLLPLALQLLPELRRETGDVWRSHSELARQMGRGALLRRARAAGELIEILVIKLADRADRLAVLRAHAGPAEAGSDLPPMPFPVRLGTLAVCFFLLLWIWS